jgi:hypothetical protein
LPRPPATDATGDEDWGHIDTFVWQDGRYELTGDWGHVVIYGAPPTLMPHEKGT